MTDAAPNNASPDLSDGRCECMKYPTSRRAESLLLIAVAAASKLIAALTQ